MSAFIVGTGTMNRVVQAVMHHVDDLPDAPFAHDIPTDIGEALYRLNAEAVRQRYGEADPVPEFVWNEARSPRSIKELAACLKAVNCLIYQCTEGDVPKTAAYRQLEKVAGFLAAEIATSLPEYAAAGWDE